METDNNGLDDSLAVITVGDVTAAIDSAGLKPTPELVGAVSRLVRESLREAVVMRAFAGVRAAARRKANE
jgi:hypothetical protein